MPTGKGRGKLNYADLKKDENTMAGPKSSPLLAANTPEQSMDEYLKKLNLFRKPVAKDGSCLFRVVSEQIFKTQAHHQVVREDCIKFMRDHRKIFESFIEGSFEHYLFSLRNLKEWGGHSEISALSLLYKHDFIVYQLASSTPQDVTKNGFDKKVHLCYLNNNHYDCVYPVSFKTNAAFVQSILYELLLDNVFAEVDRREVKKSRTYSSFVEETPTSGWTEVKTKQGKGKPQETSNSSEDAWDLIIAAIPEASKNPKVNRSLKASLDPSIYRNVGLEAWESSRTEQQRYDLVVAASYQYKPGDLCLATMYESKDVSKTLRVKIHKIMSDKCIVLSENLEKQYYVHLDDLQPILNGDADYKSLPGYYNKFENDKDQDFQPQKRRGKHGRKTREDERKVEGASGFLNNDQNNSRIRGAEKDSRNNRRNVRNGGNNNGMNKKDTEGQRSTSAPAVHKAKENNNKKTDNKTDLPTEVAENLSTNTEGEDGPVKVAKPAETAAAFWGRMRSNKLAPGQLTNGTDAFVSPEEHAMSTQQPVLSKKSSNTEPSNDKLSSSSKSIESNKNKNVNNTSDTSTYSNPNSASFKTSIPITTSTSIAAKTVAPSSANFIPRTVVSSSVPLNTLTKLPLTFAEPVTIAPRGFPIATSVSTKTAFASSTHAHTSPMISSSIEQDTRKFNLTTQASAKVNEVRENLILSTAKMEGLSFLETVSTQPSMSVGAPKISKQSLQSSGHANPNVTIQPSPNITDPENIETVIPGKKVTTESREARKLPVVQEVNPSILPTTVKGSEENRSISDNSNTAESNSAINDISPFELPVKSHDILPPHTSEPEIEILLSSDSSSTADISNESFELQQQKATTISKSGRDKVKKKVSFGCTTEIVEKPPPMLIASNTIPDTNVHVISSTEPGKIHLPPEHIEKHLNNFPNNSNPSVHYPEVIPQQMEQPPQLHSQPRIVQPSFIHQSGIPFYPHQQTHLPPVIPMFYRPNMSGDPRNVPQLSHDPEGKDLPEDIGVLQYFYNLGVQYVYAQNVHQMNQAGILPLPVVTPLQTLQPRSFVLNADTATRTGELINANSQTNEAATVEIQHQQTQPNIMQTRIQAPHINFHHPHMQQGAPFEEYETPPRLRRSGPIPAGVTIGMAGPTAHRIHQRHHFPQHRHILNGRGIMGQGPKSHRTEHIRIQSAYPPPPM